MNHIRNKKHRIAISLLTAAAVVLLTASIPNTSGGPGILAWWGTLYPKFCYSQIAPSSEEEAAGRDRSESHVKISFWLAKAWNW